MMGLPLSGKLVEILISLPFGFLCPYLFWEPRVSKDYHTQPTWGGEGAVSLHFALSLPHPPSSQGQRKGQNKWLN